MKDKYSINKPVDVKEKLRLHYITAAITSLYLKILQFLKTHFP